MKPRGRALEAGVDKLADAVRVNAGPARPACGCWAKAFWRPCGSPTTVSPLAREIDLGRPVRESGRPAGQVGGHPRTNDVAGDGTTTATVLAQAIIKGRATQCCRPAPTRSSLGLGISKGLPTAGVRGRYYLASATPVSGKERYRPGSHGGRRVTSRSGKLVGEAMTKVGHDGVVSVEESFDAEPPSWSSHEGVGLSTRASCRQ